MEDINPNKEEVETPQVRVAPLVQLCHLCHENPIDSAYCEECGTKICLTCIFSTTSCSLPENLKRLCKYCKYPTHDNDICGDCTWISKMHSTLPVENWITRAHFLQNDRPINIFPFLNVTFRQWFNSFE